MKTLFWLISAVFATTVSYRLAPHEKACFYTEVKRATEKLGFYFAVQEGGNFDIDYEVYDPQNELVLSENAIRQGDYAFSSKMVGEYSFCFSNTMSTFAEKLIDFDITVEHDVQQVKFIKSDLEESLGSTSTKEKPKDPLGDSVLIAGSTLSQSMASLSRQQRLIKNKEHRNFYAVSKAKERIVMFCVVESLVVVGMAFGQVSVIKGFFNKSRMTRV